MIFRFTLTDEIGDSFQISEPSGWDNGSIGFERHPDFYSLVEYFKSNFQAYGSNGVEDGGRDWILQREKTYGPDGDIDILVELDYDEIGNYETIYQGQMAIGLLVETLDTDHLLEIVFTQQNFWTRLINRYKTKVDIRSSTDLDGNAVTATPKFTLPLPSQKIEKRFLGELPVPPIPVILLYQASAPSAVYFINYSTAHRVFDELENVFDYATAFSLTSPTDLQKCQIETSEDGDFLINITINYKLQSDYAGSTFTVEWYIVTGRNGAFTVTQIGTTDTVTAIQISGSKSLVNHAVSLKQGDQIYVYAKLTYVTNPFGSTLSILYNGDFIIDVVANTTVTDSTADAFLTHDVASGIIDRIAGQTGLFYSEYLGNAFTSRVYPATGCGSLLANMKGLHLRGYLLTDKPFFGSLEEWWTGINPIHNLGLGYEKVGGLDVIRVERKEHFFDDTEFSILLSNVYKIKRSYDDEKQFKEVKIGFEKWQSQATNGVGTPSGIDDPQTVRTFASRLKKIGKSITILSKWVAASLTIETTRRVTTLKSANYTYDDNDFVIALKSLGGGSFTPELNENFSSITNLKNPTTRYNTKLTPARNFLRWLNFLSGGLQSYLSSYFKFTSGEGNYNMQSTMVTSCDGDDTGVSLSEKGDIQVGTDFLMTAQIYDIEHAIDWNDYKTLRENKNKAIGVSQTETGHKKFFIKNLDYKIATGLLRLTAWAKEPFDILVIDSPATEIVDSGTFVPPTRFYESFYEPFYE